MKEILLKCEDSFVKTKAFATVQTCKYIYPVSETKILCQMPTFNKQPIKISYSAILLTSSGSILTGQHFLNMYISPQFSKISPI